MSSKTTLVLHRKSANRPEVKAAVKQVKSACIELDVKIPWNKKDKRKVVKELVNTGCRRIIAGGGDGTLNGVAHAIVEAGVDDVTMGILPLGTANDLAHGLDLPCDDLGACLEFACVEEGEATDVGQMNDHIFINVASGGFGAEVTATTPQEAKRVLGGLAYTLNGLAKLWQLEPYEGTLKLPGRGPEEGAVLLMAVGNSRLAGGGFEVAPLAKVDDGLLDLMMLRHDGVPDPAAVLNELKDPMNPDNRYIGYVQAPSFDINSHTPLHLNLDGEPVVTETMAFSVLPGALKVVR
jgi:lipid kinase YegS